MRTKARRPGALIPSSLVIRICGRISRKSFPNVEECELPLCSGPHRFSTTDTCSTLQTVSSTKGALLPGKAGKKIGRRQYGKLGGRENHMVGTTGFEPAASPTPRVRATRL